jgi:hypothetical protein
LNVREALWLPVDEPAMVGEPGSEKLVIEKARDQVWTLSLYFTWPTNRRWAHAQSSD